MFFVYAIKSKVDGRIYVGFSTDPVKRLKEHNAGKTKSTKGFRPWEIIYQETAKTRTEARAREIFLKSGSGKEFLKSIKDLGIL
ncbi:GIY-YIG nuclease family protein [Litoribacter ruber]|uniref:GIY-YIG nuclease family protein n=1 Tax=Litoribacter ruber TaxID=702568 RepID=A0AAP2CGV2_9BACT|nr:MULTISPECIES: GIY-YIG nuclease family protein [Litoribacter]MBS9524416.1 GIY-YIG nuclease family protein [Litoribacter alkaliphilus]MBT0809786.1 GIY-YIG nuclease family protein [Litoribacter ruber]